MKLFKRIQADLMVFFACLFFSLCVASAQGNLVVNGGFDTSVAGWTLANGADYSSSKGNPAGSVVLATNPPSSPTVSQAIVGLIIGNSYEVSGNYTYLNNTGSGSPTAYSFGVSMNGTFVFETVSPGSNAWLRFDVPYTAASSSAILALASEINGTGVGYIVDNISIVPVPEPGSLYLLEMGGIIGIFIFKRR